MFNKVISSGGRELEYGKKVQVHGRVLGDGKGQVHDRQGRVWAGNRVRAHDKVRGGVGQDVGGGAWGHGGVLVHGILGLGGDDGGQDGAPSRGECRGSSRGQH